MKQASFFLPWPDKKLSPNARQHWAILAKAKSHAKERAFWLTKEARIGKIEAERLSVRYVIFPPDRRARDQDNIIASIKAYADGIAQAIGLDDSKWDISIVSGGSRGREGMIKVELEWEHKEQAA